MDSGSSPALDQISKSAAEILAKWKQYNDKVNSTTTPSRENSVAATAMVQTPPVQVPTRVHAKGSKKGCMKGTLTLEVDKAIPVITQCERLELSLGDNPPGKLSETDTINLSLGEKSWPLKGSYSLEYEASLQLGNGSSGCQHEIKYTVKQEPPEKILFDLSKVVSVAKEVSEKTPMEGEVSPESTTTSDSSKSVDMIAGSSKVMLSDSKDLTTWLSNMRQLINAKPVEISAEAELSVLTKSNDEQIQKARAMLESLKSMDFKTISDSEFSKSFEQAIFALLSDRTQTPHGCSGLKKFWEQTTFLASDFRRAQSEISKVTEMFSSKDSLQADLGAKTIHFEKLQKADADWDKKIEMIEAKIARLQSQLKKEKERKANNSFEMRKLFKETEEKGAFFSRCLEEEPTWMLKKRKAERDIKRVENDWEELKKEFLPL